MTAALASLERSMVGEPAAAGGLSPRPPGTCCRSFVTRPPRCAFSLSLFRRSSSLDFFLHAAPPADMTWQARSNSGGQAFNSTSGGAGGMPAPPAMVGAAAGEEEAAEGQ